MRYPTLISRESLMATACRHSQMFAGLMLAGSMLAGSHSLRAGTWTGATSTDWNTATNWSGGNGGTVQVNTITPRIATITATISTVPTTIILGNGATAVGRVDHLSGNSSVSAGNDILLGRSGGSGTYNLANTAGTGGALTGFGQGSGNITVPDQSFIGGSPTVASGGTGVLNIHTSGTVSFGTQLMLGNLTGTGAGNGTVRVDSGTVTVGTDLAIGSGAGCTGTFSMSGGAVTKNASGSTAVTIGGAPTSASLNGGTGTFNLSGGTFTSAGLISVGHRPSTNGTLNISGGILNLNSDLQVGSYTGATGSVVLSGGTINSTGWVVVGRRDGAEGVAVGGVGSVTMTGGTWNKTGDSNFIVGAHGAGTMNMSGGLVNVGTSAVTDRGVTWVGEQNNCTGTLTLSGSAEFRTARITMGVQTGTTGTLNLNGGTLKTAGITGGVGTSVVSFDGTQIVATGSSNTFINALGTATINPGHLRVDTAGFNLSSNQFLTGTGGVVKSGAGTLSIPAANDYTGSHQINQGKLVLSTEHTGGGDVTVADGAVFGIVKNVDITLSSPNVTMGSSGASTLDIDLGTEAGNPTSPVLNVGTNLTLNGTVTVNIADANPQVGSFPVITYAAKSGAGSFVLGSLPSGVSATLTDDNAGTVTLDITNISFPKWTGAVDGNWDTVTQNWIDLLSSSPSNFVNGAPVLFDDTATGPSTVALIGTLTPGDVKIETNTLAYTLNGTGKLSGSTGLTKNGTTDLVLNTANDFTGQVNLNGGIVSFDNATLGGASGLGSGSTPVVLAGSSLNYTGPNGGINRGLAINMAGTQITNANDLAVAGQVTSTGGSFTKLGAGNLKLTHPGANVLGNAGNILIHAGTLTLDGGGLQTNHVTGEMWVADQPDIIADLVLNNTSLTTTNWLAIGRGNGNNGVVNLTATGSAITTVNFSTGYDNALANNASEAFVNLHNTTWTNNGLTYLAESQGSTAVMNLTGSSQYNINNNLLLARNAATCLATLTLSDTSSLTKTGGYTSIGTNGVGTLTVQNNATFTSVTGDFNISDVGTSTGTLNLKDSGTINVTNVYIGKNSSTTGNFSQTGGTFSSGSFVSIGRFFASNGTVDVSAGSLSSTSVIVVGEEGNGTLNVSGTGTVTANGDAIYVGGTATTFGGTGTLNLNGGTVVAKKIAGGTIGNSSVNFNGGLLKAGTGATAPFIGGFDSAVILSGGARIDSNGQSLTVSQILSGTGGFTKSGTGTVTLSGTHTYTGPTAVNAGTLSVSSAYFANTSAISIAGGAVLNLNHALTDEVGSLTINGASMPAGIYDSTTSPGYITGTGKLSVTGTASAYDTWISGYPSIPLADRDPGDDPDGDGASNALEFALGGVPNNSSNNPKVYSLIADSSVDGDTTKELLLTIAVRAGTPAFSGSPSPGAVQDGFTYRVDGSTTLATFNTVVNPVNPVTAGLPAAPSGYEYRSFSLSGSNGTSGKGFLRVQVVSP